MCGKVRDRILRVLANNPSWDMSKYEIARHANALIDYPACCVTGSRFISSQ